MTRLRGKGRGKLSTTSPGEAPFFFEAPGWPQQPVGSSTHCVDWTYPNFRTPDNNFAREGRSHSSTF
jgi:hypothetical protein